MFLRIGIVLGMVLTFGLAFGGTAIVQPTSTPKLEFGQSRGITECVNQASLKGPCGFWRFVLALGCE